MLPASNKGVGMNMGFPDVCLTPAVPAPVPIPYPNMAMNAMAAPFCPTIFLSAMPALNQGSIIPMTLGMQPGVANPLYMQMGMYTMGNPKVILQGLPAINLTCPTTGNGMNNAAGAVLVPSVTNVFFAYAGEAPSGDALTVAELEELERAVDGGAAVEARTLTDGVRCVRIRRFSSDVAPLVYRAIGAGEDDVIVDLRGNRGGDLRAAIELAGDFLAEGCVIATLVDADGDAAERRASTAPLYPSRVVVIVVDGDTASAAEVFAGSLKAQRRAFVVGARTYGKGDAYTVVRGDDDAAVRARAATVVLPDGAAIGGVGVEPDLAWPFDAASLPRAIGALSARVVDALCSLGSD
ncbi:MAG TPA: S41 family peptidase [Byssovorax sp.]|jgi:carboxyl-terminal processing protease